MNILNDIGFCSCCNNYCEYRFGEENFKDNETSLENYLNFKDVYVYRCPKCNFVSTNITEKENVSIKDIVESEEYNNLLNNEYLKGMADDVYENHSRAVPAYLYEAYAFTCLKANNFEKYIRVMNKCIELKEMTVRKYLFSQAECAEEDENDEEYETIINLIKKSIYENSLTLNKYFLKLDNKTLFFRLIFLENLIRINKFKEVEELIEKMELDDEMVKYLTEKLYHHKKYLSYKK